MKTTEKEFNDRIDYFQKRGKYNPLKNKNDKIFDAYLDKALSGILEKFEPTQRREDIIDEMIKKLNKVPLGRRLSKMKKITFEREDTIRILEGESAEMWDARHNSPCPDEIEKARKYKLKWKIFPKKIK